MSDIKFSDIWQTLSTIDCKGHTEKKDVGKGVKLTYLSWTWAWGITMKHYPCATYSIREWDGKPYLNDPVTGVMVMTEVNIGGNVRKMWLAVMDGANNAMKSEPYTVTVKGRDGRPFEKRVAGADMCAINKAIMRCLVKNLAMFGLGLNIYAGEDLPVGVEDDGSSERALGPGESAGTSRKAANPAPAASVNVKRINASEKAKEAWAAFKALPGNVGLNAKQIADAWKKFVTEEIGEFESSATVTDEQWEKVLRRVMSDEL